MFTSASGLSDFNISRRGNDVELAFSDELEIQNINLILTKDQFKVFSGLVIRYHMWTFRKNPSSSKDTPNFAESFGLRLKAARKERGWTQKSLAEATKISPSALSKYENGKRLPDIVNLAALAYAMDCSADILLF